MLIPSYSSPLISGIAVLTSLCLLVRPFHWPEAIWAVLAAAVLTVSGMISWSSAWAGISKGLDVYLFLVGMMLISELANKEGLFDWMAAIATSHANGSPKRLFLLIYVVGIVVTVFMSNDATAVVLTPAVYVACKAANVKDPLPYLLVCAFIANAASFVLPISNPANLVIFNGGHMPSLSEWLAAFAIPSILAIGVTYLALFWTQRKALAIDTVAAHVHQPKLTLAAKVAGLGLIATAIGLMIASALNVDLGWPTFIAGVATLALVSAITRESPVGMLTGISWSVIPLVAGLFVVVEAVAQTGMIDRLAEVLEAGTAAFPHRTAAIAGIVTAFTGNIVNNLPAGLVAGSVVQLAHAPRTISASILIGIDLGPNLSITGSLATILWLNALRREGIEVGFWQFLRVGGLIMIPAMLASIAGVIVIQLLRT